ncbi:MAG: HAMP domain-containing histidine kinase [Lachnospiraceae bacterium]|nr:HAMP domain-containing histidine kinase [Lachnospiraceae bacterium]
MDWLEEKTEQLWNFLQEKSLVRALIWYLCICTVGVIAAYWITRNLCLVWIEVLEKRQMQAEAYHSDPRLRAALTEQKSWENFCLLVLKSFYGACLYLYILAGFAAAGRIFLETRIKPPIAAITRGLNYINMGDYSHEIIWRGKDEMGFLCREMEQMRKEMLKNKKQQWRQQEEQRKINAAFAHDIRTPLTVIRGYTEFLQRYVPSGRVTEAMLMEKLNTMHEQEERLLRFSETMTTVQNIEKREPSGVWHSSGQVIRQLAAVVCGIGQNTELEIALEADLPEQELFLDLELLIEVFENLLSNAMRYAVRSIQAKAVLNGRELTVFVKDDGPGFSEKALRMGMDVYFSEEENSREHFGIGLSICRMLCESHGGSLSLQNSVEQGAIAAASLVTGVR